MARKEIQTVSVLDDDLFWASLVGGFDATIHDTLKDVFESGVFAGRSINANKEINFRVIETVPDLTDLDDTAERAIVDYTSKLYEKIMPVSRNALKEAVIMARREGLGVEYVLGVAKTLFSPERAKTIAVTETTRLFGLGAQAAYKATGIEEWVWHTVNDPFVDEHCADKAGERFHIDEPFEPEHPNCRCFPVPVYEESWEYDYAAAELGRGRAKEFDPNQPRDALGKWESSGDSGGGATAVADRPPQDTTPPGTGPLKEQAYTYLKKNYPEETLEWVREAKWEFGKVPLDKIDYQSRPGGRDHQRSVDIAKAVQEGKAKLSPIVVVEKTNGRYTLADGYHRTGVFAQLGYDTAVAFIASGVGDNGPWDKEMHDKKLNVAKKMLQFLGALFGRKEFNPDQPRDELGKWSSDGGGNDSSVDMGRDANDRWIEAGNYRKPNDDEIVDTGDGQYDPVPLNRGPGTVLSREDAMAFSKGPMGGNVWLSGGGKAAYIGVSTSNLSMSGRGVYLIESTVPEAREVAGQFGGIREYTLAVEKPLNKYGSEAKALLATPEAVGIRKFFDNHGSGTWETHNMATLQVIAQRQGYDALYYNAESGGRVVSVFDATKVALIDDSIGKKDFNPDQPRDEIGRWAGSGSVSLSSTKERAWDGKARPDATKLSRNEAGKLGEAVILEHLKQNGYPDAVPLNVERPNYPVDAVADHNVYEIKTGQVSNSARAQQWRATIGQPGKAETALLRTMDSETKALWNEQKNVAIMARKEAALADISAAVGHPVTGKTVTTVIDPDRKVVDVFEFEGFHQRLGWAGSESNHVASYKYD